jgi:hypothetical protein
MSLENLCVIHRHKGPGSLLPSQNGPKADSLSGAFYLDTCQRVLWVCTQDDFEEVQETIDWSAYEIFSGVKAYSFLLRVATGLESQVVGETDVFGQLKEAWRKAAPQLNEDTDFWIQKIFEDTKEVRSRHLQHLGGRFVRNLSSQIFERSRKPRTDAFGGCRSARSIGGAFLA